MGGGGDAAGFPPTNHTHARVCQQGCWEAFCGTGRGGSSSASFG
jgi:hypothetical protein